MSHTVLTQLKYAGFDIKKLDIPEGLGDDEKRRAKKARDQTLRNALIDFLKPSDEEEMLAHLRGASARSIRPNDVASYISEFERLMSVVIDKPEMIYSDFQLSDRTEGPSA